MDRLSSVMAALDAGKLPSQAQMSAFIDWFLDSPLAQIEPTSEGGDLSEQGSILVGDIRELCIAYKLLGEHNNSDNLVQQALWHLSQADISDTTTKIADEASKDQARKDAAALARSIRTIFHIIWSNLSLESQHVFHDFASFTRLALADAADYVSRSAGSAAEGLRDVNDQIERGERNELGVKHVSEEDKFQNKDAKEQWEIGADTAKVAGSKAIGAGQVAVQTSEELANRSNQRLQDAFYQVCDRAQDDEGYHASISTIFSVLSKWLNKSLDAAGDVNADTSLEAFIDDPTPEKHLIQALRALRTALERAAGGASLDGFFGALRVCGVDVRQDEKIRTWAEGVLAHAQRALQERGYVRSDAAKQEREGLRERWEEMTGTESEEMQKWREDVDRLRDEWTTFEVQFSEGEDLARVKRAVAKLGADLEGVFGTAAGAGAQKASEQSVWLWQDLFNAHLPRFMDIVKDIPVPRTEYKDADVEFVLEDLDVSRFALLPGHAYIRNITDIDIKAPSSGVAQTAVGSLTRVYAQGVQLALRDVSFWFKQKTATVAPSELSGLLALTLPPQGVDVDVVVRTIPSSPEGLTERGERKRFLDVQRVQVKLSDDMEVTIAETNHPVLAPLLRPIIAARVRDAVESALSGHVRSALEGADALAWDIGARADVFEDAGLQRGPALVAGAWSELGRMRRAEGGSGLLSGWRATGTGLVKEDAEKDGKGRAAGSTFAVGAEPQVLGGEKRGPRGNFSESLGERAQKTGAVPDEQDVADVTVEVGQRAKEVVSEAKEAVKGGVREVKSFGEAVRVKTEEEKSQQGWESHAFDVEISA